MDIRVKVLVRTTATEAWSDLYFKVKRTAPLSKVKNTIAQRMGKEPGLTCLTYEGSRVGRFDSLQKFYFQDGDFFEAHFMQIGC